MPTNPKREAEITEDAGLLALPVEAPAEAEVAVAGPGDESASTTPEEKPKTKEEERAQPKPPLVRQDKLDRERAAGEGMIAPPSHPEA